MGLFNKLEDGINVIQNALLQWKHMLTLDYPVLPGDDNFFFEVTQGMFWFHLNGDRQFVDGALVWFDKPMVDTEDINWPEWDLVDVDYDDTERTEYYRHRTTGKMMCQSCSVDEALDWSYDTSADIFI